MTHERELTKYVGLGDYEIVPEQSFTYFHDINRRTFVSLNREGIVLDASREWDSPGGTLRLTWDDLREFLRAKGRA